MTAKERFPRCNKLQVLRTISGRTVISTSALYEALGWKKYRQFLPYMEYEPTHGNNGYVTAESAEAFLNRTK
jgi:hypothetical protein